MAGTIEWLLKNEPIGVWSFFLGLIIASIYYILSQTKWSKTAPLFLLLGGIIAFAVTQIPNSNITHNYSYFYLFLCGMIATVAMVLPGVSGSFIFLILGVYPIILKTIKEIPVALLKGDWEAFFPLFLRVISIGLGVVIGLKIFSRALHWMFRNHKNETLFLLIGFMLGALHKIWPWQLEVSSLIKENGEKIVLKTKAISPFLYPDNNYLLLSISLFIFGFIFIFIIQKLDFRKK